jgi:hypothetical protein
LDNKNADVGGNFGIMPFCLGPDKALPDHCDNIPCNSIKAAA